ncbi:MAG: hypothetical protein ABFS17_13965 [Chloroflexota bacterium]
MRLKLTEFLKKNSLVLAVIAGLLGFLVYALQSWEFAHSLTTMVWDEAMYLYKGSIFANGEFQPFEDYGPWTNQMPVSFLIPGYIQKWFGMGMYSGRMYAFGLGLLTVVGLSLASYRSGGKWWAVAAIWVVALNSGWIKAFSQVYAQGLVSFFFAWMLALAAGKDRKIWELCLAAALAGLAGMSRINVLPVVFFFIMYVIWQYGWKTGAWVAGAGLFPVVLFHALYWPDVLKIWAYWVPPELYTGIAEFRSPWREVFIPDGFSWWPISNWIGTPDHLAWRGISTFFLAVRANFIPFFGVLVSLLLWPKKESWKSEHQRKFSIFLILVYLVMLVVHLWAALGGKTCLFSCLPGYMLFFDFFGLVLIFAIAPSWNLNKRLWKQIAILFLIFVLVIAMESSYEHDNFVLRNQLGEQSFGINIPRFKNGAWVEGSIPLLEIIENKFGIEKFPVRQYILYDPGFDQVVKWTTILGISFLAPLLLYLLLAKGNRNFNLPIGKVVIFSTFGVGMLFASSGFFVQGLDTLTCSDNVIASHEQVGAELGEVIPAGSQVFWDVKSDMLLLYLPDVDIYLPQANARFTLVSDPAADWDQLERFGWWNYQLGEDWIKQADYIVVETRFFNSVWDWGRRVNAGEFEDVFRSSNPESCRPGISSVVVLQPINP